MNEDFEEMMAALNAARGKDFWASHEGADAIAAMCRFTGCDDLERIEENIRHELTRDPIEEDGDPYFSGAVR